MFPKKQLFFSLLILLNSLIGFSQGSGNELLFDGVNDFADGNNAALSSFTNNFTFEMWISPSASITVKPEQNGNTDVSGTTGNGQRYAIGPNWGGATNAGAGISIGSNCIQVYEHGASYMPALLSYNTALPSGWNHIAVVYIAKQPRLYLNGELVKTGLTSIRANVFPSAFIGGYNIYGHYQGRMDEVRIWSTSRTQAEIRENMCKKLVGNEAGLIRYYRLDHPANTATATDATSNQNAILQNMATATCWVTSGAAIGDVSANTYTNNWASVTVSLTSTNKGEFVVDNVAGTTAPAGVHVYRVDAVPSSTTGLTGLGGNNTYFGTYVVRGTAPTHRTNFFFTNYPDALSDEPNLALFTRANNSVATWTNSSSTLNTGLDRLQKTGVTVRAEYVLTNPTSPLPIELLYFNAACNQANLKFSWATATESNNDFFTIERSSDGLNFNILGTVAGAGNSKQTQNYSFTDQVLNNEISYYRLKQTDFNGQFEYSKIIAVSCGDAKLKDIKVYPNLATDEVTLETTGNMESVNFEIINSTGEVIYQGNFNEKMTLQTSSFAAGIYVIKFANDYISECKKLIKQ
jgi:hypothetical protein